jgi:hypothetical protein
VHGVLERHEPSIGHYLGRLLGQKGLSMQKGSVARLDFQDADHPAKLVWTLLPRPLAPPP